jgi:hypothetical protein
MAYALKTVNVNCLAAGGWAAAEVMRVKRVKKVRPSAGGAGKAAKILQP